jgi:putative transposase
MTYATDFTLPSALLEQLSDQGLDAIPEMMRIVLNTAMLAERQRFLNAGPYERSNDRTAHANGFKPKTVTTRLGQVTFEIPQVREGGFYPQALEKGLRSERALKLALAEMYVQGVSTRKVAAITEQLCGVEVSSSQVSAASAQLDPCLEKWRHRPLGQFPYIFVDARYEKVRVDGAVLDAALLIASGVDLAGKRQILGVSVATSEAEVHWRTFFSGLVARGLSGVQLIISDDHAGLGAARKAVFGGIAWQRCQFHFQQNAGSYVPKVEMRMEVAADIRSIFNANDRAGAEARLKEVVLKYTQSASKLAGWLEENAAQSLTVFNFPAAHRRLIRTTNSLERVNQEVARRTRVARIFPNEASLLRLSSALLMEISEEWEGGKVYLTFEAGPA